MKNAIYLRTEEPTAEEKNNGAEVVFIYSPAFSGGEEIRVYGATCYESFEQWGAPVEILSKNVDRIEAWRAEQPEEQPEYNINWDKVNLNDGFQRDQNIIDPLNFDTLLLEIQTNCKEITPEEVEKQFNTDLENRVREAKEIFKNNLQNITRQALKERAQK